MRPGAAIERRPGRRDTVRSNLSENGAPLQIDATGGGSIQPCSTDVRFDRLAVSKLAPSEEGTAKWRFGPSKKHHLPPISTTVLAMGSGLFREFFPDGANWREFGPEKRRDESRMAVPRRADPAQGVNASARWLVHRFSAFFLQPEDRHHPVKILSS
jgi:hypothetical protein